MKNNIFIPEKIRVGYQERQDCFTGFLAYCVYFDDKGKLRKEASWNSWRDKSIEPNDYDNIPTSGFVLNKKVGGYSTGWNHRATYTRVYDERGFEFEITIPNLLYILENTSAIKGKGLEGEFVYGWDGKDLLLIPTSSPDYQELTSFSASLYNQEKITSKNIIVGATYLTNKNEQWIYLGRYPEFETNSYRNEKGKNLGNKYFFYDGKYFVTLSSLSKKIIKTVGSECCENYAEFMDELTETEMYSPYDPTKDVLEPIDVEKTIKKVNKVLKNQYDYGNLKVVFKYNDIDLVATVRNNISSYCYCHDSKELSLAILNIDRRYPETAQWEYTQNGYHSSDEGWEYYYENGNFWVNRRYRRDLPLHFIKRELIGKKYINNNLTPDEFRAINNELQFSTVHKYLVNGKRLKEETY